MYNEHVHLNITGREATGLPVRTIRSAQAVGGGKARRRLLLFLTVLVLLTGVCFWYVEFYYRADTEAIAAFSDDLRVEERTLEDGDLCFGTGNEACGLIFYPGGKVEHTAYVPLMRELASEGVFCVLCPMPLRLAVLDENAADGIREAFPGVGTWYLCGHSLGGTMAASYLAEHSSDYAGLILLASYSTSDLSDAGLRALSIRGSEDGVLNLSRYESCLSKLPSDTEEIVLAGGCHAYFGMYGAQSGDGVPTISGETQIRQTAAAILSWLGAEAVPAERAAQRPNENGKRESECRN